MKICNQCQKEYSDEFSYCPICGETLKKKIHNFWPYCGEALLEQDNNCPKCHLSVLKIEKRIAPLPSKKTNSLSIISSILSFLIVILSFISLFTPFMKIIDFNGGFIIEKNYNITYFLTDLLNIGKSRPNLKYLVNSSFYFTIITLIALVILLILAIFYFIKNALSDNCSKHSLWIAFISFFCFITFYFYQKIMLYGSTPEDVSLGTAGIIYFILTILLIFGALVFYYLSYAKEINEKFLISRCFLNGIGISLIILSFIILSDKVYEITSNFGNIHYSSLQHIADFSNEEFLYYIAPLYFILQTIALVYFSKMLIQIEPKPINYWLICSFLLVTIIYFSLIFMLTQQMLTDMEFFIVEIDYLPTILSFAFQLIAGVLWLIGNKIQSKKAEIA